MLLILVFASSTAIVSGSGQFGVSVGDWVKYRVIRLGHETAWTDHHDWVKIEVLNVSGTSVTIVETLYYPNGETFNRTESADFYIQPANLTIGDEAFSKTYRYPWLNNTIHISQITSRAYGGESREACLAEFSYSQPYFRYMLDVHEEYWWDKATGVLLEETFETTFQGYGNASKSTESLVAEETNLWETHGPPSPLLQLAFLGIISAILVGAVGIVLKRNKTKKEA